MQLGHAFDFRGVSLDECLYVGAIVGDLHDRAAFGTIPGAGEDTTTQRCVSATALGAEQRLPLCRCNADLIGVFGCHMVTLADAGRLDAGSRPGERRRAAGIRCIAELPFSCAFCHGVHPSVAQNVKLKQQKALDLTSLRVATCGILADMSIGNQLTKTFTNASGGNLDLGMLVRGLPGTAQATVADAAAEATAVTIAVVGSLRASAGAAFRAQVNGVTDVLLESGLTPISGQPIFISATQPGRGTKAACGPRDWRHHRQLCKGAIQPRGTGSAC